MCRCITYKSICGILCLILILLLLHQENRDKLEAEVEQFYADDPGKTRELFLEAINKLKKMKGSDWFMVRNYDQPPPVLATLFSAVCTLMLVRDSWKSARNLVGSSVQNMEVHNNKQEIKKGRMRDT